jgi:ABC-2 type transport system permease protein
MLAVLQTLLFLLIGPLLAWVGLSPDIDTGLTAANFLPVLGWLTLLGVALTGLGYLIAWPMDSTHGFHAIMSVFLLPMWLLSGAVFPATESSWLNLIVRLNPLTYGVAGLWGLMAANAESVMHLPSGLVCGTVTGLFCFVCLAGAVALTNRRSVLNAR